MAYLVKADLASHLYSENIDEITRADDTKVTTAINAAIAEAKGYLSRYNVVKLFDDADADFVDDPALEDHVKSIAVWKLLRLCNVNIPLEVMRTNFEDAIAWLKDVQKGMVDPDGWPYKDDNADTGYVEGSTIQISSNDKRTNHF